MAGPQNSRGSGAAPRRSPGAVMFVVLLLCLSCCRASIIAVDLGTEFMKVALVQSARPPISIVINEISKRKSPALVGFVGPDRMVGEEAASMAKKLPGSFLSGLATLAGRDADDPAVSALADQGGALRVPVVSGTNRSSSLALDFGPESGVYTPEELVASLLEYAVEIARQASADGTVPRDLVLVAPTSMGSRQRQALADAAAAAKLNLLGFVGPGAAAALQYGIDRTDVLSKGPPKHVLFFDMGSGITELTLTRFSSYEVKRSSACQVEVVEVVSVPHGVQDVEAALQAMLTLDAERHLGLQPGELAADAKASAKLGAGIKNIVRVLSANTEGQLSVEELYQGRDYRRVVTREELEAAGEHVWSLLGAAVRELLRLAGTAPADLADVELLGGGSRIPRVKAELAGALGGRALDMHLDADEGVVLGAGLFAANKSTQFKLRPFGLVDGAPYAIDYEVAGDGAGGAAPAPLVKARARLPSRRVVGLLSLVNGSLAAYDDVDVKLFETRAGGAERTEIGAWHLGGLQAEMRRHANVSKLGLHVRIDEAGVPTVTGADMTVSQTVEAPQANATSDAGPNATLSSQPASPRVLTTRVPLAIEGGWVKPAMTAAQVAASRDVLAALAARDRVKRQTAQAKNDLESYILRAGSWVAADEDVLATSTEDERAALVLALEKAEDWLYGEGESADEAAYHKLTREIMGQGEPLRLRGLERAARPKALEDARSALATAKPVAESWGTTKPWLPAADVAAIKKSVAAFEAWLVTIAREQASKSDLDPPAFTSDQVRQRLSQIVEGIARLQRRAAPRPPPAPPAPKGEARANATEPGDAANDRGAGTTPPAGDKSEL